VRDLLQHIETCRADLGDAALDVAGANCRPLGRVPEGKPLTVQDPDNPYLEALYDLEDAG
jgi:hypothetical protein